MLRYKNLGNSIVIDLHNGYSIVAMTLWNYDASYYEVSLYIKDNAIETLCLMEKYEKIKFTSDQRNIKSDIASYVSIFLHEGKFQEYIDDYIYQMDCFDRGNGLYEDERYSIE